MTMLEDFIEYCKEDNTKLAMDIETWLADFIDIPNRTIPLDQGEIDWIKNNFNKENQKRIFGKVVK